MSRLYIRIHRANRFGMWATTPTPIAEMSSLGVRSQNVIRNYSVARTPPAGAELGV